MANVNQMVSALNLGSDIIDQLIDTLGTRDVAELTPEQGLLLKSCLQISINRLSKQKEAIASKVDKTDEDETFILSATEQIKDLGNIIIDIIS